MQWYYSSRGQRQGPVSSAEFSRLVAGGTIGPATLVWRNGFTGWIPYAALPPDALAGSEASEPEPAPQPEFSYGGFWIRFCAKVIDLVLLGLAGALLDVALAVLMPGSAHLTPNPSGPAPGPALAFQGAAVLGRVVLGLSYDCFFISRHQATPGKLALGLKIIRSDGSRLGIGRIIGRYFAEGLSALIFMIGYIVAAFDAEKRALHDLICDTRVVKAKP